MLRNTLINLLFSPQTKQEALKIALKDYNPSYRNDDAVFTKQGGFHVMTSEMSKGEFDSSDGGFKKVGIDIVDRLWKPTMLLSTTIIANNRGMDGQMPPSLSVRVYDAKNLVCDEQIEGEEVRVILHSIAEGISMSLAAHPAFIDNPNIGPLEEVYYKAVLTPKEQQKADEYKSCLFMMHLGNVLKKALSDNPIAEGEILIVGQEPQVVQSFKRRPDTPKANGEENSHK